MHRITLDDENNVEIDSVNRIPLLDETFNLVAVSAVQDYCMF